MRLSNALGVVRRGCGRFARGLFSAATAVSSGLPVAAALSDLPGSNLYGYVAAGIVGFADGLFNYLFQGQGFEDSTGVRYDNLDACSKKRKGCSHFSQTLCLGVGTVSVAADRYFLLTAISETLEALSLGSVSGGLFWGILAVDLLIALTGKVALIDGYAITEAVARRTERGSSSESILKKLPANLKGKGLSIAKCVILAEGCLAEDTIPLALLPTGFFSDIKKGDGLLHKLMIGSTTTAAAAAPLMLTLRRYFDGIALDNHAASARGEPKKPAKIELSKKSGVACIKLLLGLACFIRGPATAVPAMLALKSILQQESVSNLTNLISSLILAGTLSAILIAGNQVTEANPIQVTQRDPTTRPGTEV